MIYSVAGVVCAVILLIMVIVGAGTGVSSFLDPLSIGIVFGGVFAAALISFRGNQIKAVLQAFVLIFREEPDIEPEIAQLVKFGGEYMRKDIKAAETTIARTTSPFLKLGFQLVLDNTTLDDMMRILEWRVHQLREQELSTTRCFKNLAAASPAFGMLGTLVGLIAMLASLESMDIAIISGNLAMALTTTVYGVVLAYLVFKPISIKLEQRTYRRVFMLNVLMDGLLLVRVGRGPAMIEDNLRHLLMENRDEVRGVD